MEEVNPVVLLVENRWHIVEHSRRSAYALCGRRLSERRAHARLKQVGAPDLCSDCFSLWSEPTGDGK